MTKLLRFRSTNRYGFRGIKLPQIANTPNDLNNPALKTTPFTLNTSRPSDPKFFFLFCCTAIKFQYTFVKNRKCTE